MRYFLISVMAGFFLSGCAGQHVSEIPEAVRIGVYAETDAIHAGRYDLAEQYGDNLLRIVPAPKVRLSFTPALRAVAPSAPAVHHRDLAGLIPLPAPSAAPVTYERVNIAPLDAAALTLNVNAPETSALLSTPTAVAETKAAVTYSATVDKQQVTQAAQATKDAAQVEKDKTVIAAQSKWKYMVLTAVAIVTLSVLAYVAWKLKWFGI